MSAACFIARNYYNALAATLCQRSIFFLSFSSYDISLEPGGINKGLFRQRRRLFSLQ